MNRALVNRRPHYEPEAIRAIAKTLSRELEILPAAGPDLPPLEPSRYRQLLKTVSRGIAEASPSAVVLISFGTGALLSLLAPARTAYYLEVMSVLSRALAGLYGS